MQNSYIDKKEKEKLLQKIDSQIDSYIYTRINTENIEKKGLIHKVAMMISKEKK